VYTRTSILAWFTLFYLLGWAPITLLLFGAIDFLGAIWTWTSLKKVKL
jgi:hypothetical protein